jgi:GDP-4-dehydro-6-deoxy-D-mannose reductase
MPGGTTVITGATGFVGRHLLERYAGRTVVAWHNPHGRMPEAIDGVEWRAVDLLDRGAVEAALEADTPARVVHLAGAAQVDSSWQTIVPHLKTNALGTYYLLDALRRTELPCRILVVTSGQIYQPSDEPLDEDAPLLPPNPYGLSKLAQDQLAVRAVTEDGLDVVVARPFNHTGPGQSPAFVVSSFAQQIAQVEAGQAPPTIVVGNLDSRRDITDVRDVVDAYDILLAHAPPGRPYNICSGRAWRIGDLLDELLQLARVSMEVVVDDERIRPSDVVVLQGDATRIRSELGWAPHIPVEQTLRDTLDWWREHT